MIIFLENPMAETNPQTGEPITWSVYRQDDNGNQFLVEKGLTQGKAEELATLFEQRGHKQLYWVEPDQ